MENIVIPNDFYIIQFREFHHIAHNSCRYNNNKPSNGKYTFFYYDDVLHCINTLRDICNIYDILNEKTYFKENVYKNIYTKIFNKSILVLNIGSNNIIGPRDRIEFRSIECLLEYLAENYPECIKIALKD